MPIEHINPPTLPQAQGYIHIVKAGGGTTFYIGVERLAFDEMLVEVDAIAVID